MIQVCGRRLFEDAQLLQHPCDPLAIRVSCHLLDRRLAPWLEKAIMCLVDVSCGCHFVGLDSESLKAVKGIISEVSRLYR